MVGECCNRPSSKLRLGEKLSKQFQNDRSFIRLSNGSPPEHRQIV
jgi:hypothetical protein